MRIILLFMMILIGSISPCQSQSEPAVESEEAEGTAEEEMSFMVSYAEMYLDEITEMKMIAVEGGFLYTDQQETKMLRLGSRYDNPESTSKTVELSDRELRPFLRWADDYDLCEVDPPPSVERATEMGVTYYSFELRYGNKNCAISWSDESEWKWQREQKDVERAIRDLKALAKKYGRY